MEQLALYGGRPVRDTFLVFGSPRIEEDEIAEVVDSLRSGWLGTGPKVHQFEEEFKKFIGSKYALALNSCTAGLHLALLAAGIKPNDEIITTPMTFAATVNAILHVGAKPIFVDVDKSSMNICVNHLEKKITARTRAIIPVHMAGRPCDMDAIMKIAKKYNLLVIEDAAHAIEAVYKNRKIGNIGDLTVFSFYVTKNICTGEGGMITTNNSKFAELIELYALHGLDKGAWMRYSDKGFKHYQVVLPGFKYNMMDIQASLGIHQLKKVMAYHARRESIWKQYDAAFKNLPIFIPAPVNEEDIHARHLYTILLDLDRLTADRDMIQQALYAENIGTGIHFIALHLHKYYQETFGFKRGDFPNAEFISDRTISLPLSAKLTDGDVADVIQGVKKVISYFTNDI